MFKYDLYLDEYSILDTVEDSMIEFMYMISSVDGDSQIVLNKFDFKICKRGNYYCVSSNTKYDNFLELPEDIQNMIKLDFIK